MSVDNNIIKLHLACGTVYLPEYINIDIHTGDSVLCNKLDIKDRPIGRTLENYYSDVVDKDDFMSGRYHHRRVVCDIFCDITNLRSAFYDNTIDEILAVQVFEHFTYKEGVNLLKSWYELLKPGGLLHIDVPDLDGTIRLYNEAKNERDKAWAIRLLYGSQKNEYGIHKAMYTQDMMFDLFKDAGLKDIVVGDFIKHTYPAFGIKGIK